MGKIFIRMILKNIRPERFEENLIDYKETHFQYVQFGAKRQICLRMQFALSKLEIILAYMEEAFWIITRMKYPLYFVPTLSFLI